MPPVPPADAEERNKLILIYHDECIFSTNEGQLWAWATEDDNVIQPKTKGAGIMVFFISHLLKQNLPKEVRLIFQQQQEPLWNVVLIKGATGIVKSF